MKKAKKVRAITLPKKRKQRPWYKHLVLKFSLFSVAVLGVLTIAGGGIYHFAPTTDVLGARIKTTGNAHCILIHPNDPGLRTKNDYLRDYSHACQDGTGPDNGVYTDAKLCVPRDASIYMLSPNCQPAVTKRPIYVKIVDATDPKHKKPVNEQSPLWLYPRVGIHVTMDVVQMSQDKQTSYPTKDFDSNGIMTFYQYSSPISEHNDYENTVKFTVKADKSGAYTFDKNTIITKVGVKQSIFAPHACGATPSEACTFTLTRINIQPTPTPRTQCKTVVIKQNVCNNAQLCNEVSNTCGPERINFVNCKSGRGVCGSCSKINGTCTTARSCKAYGGRANSAYTCSNSNICCTQ